VRLVQHLDHRATGVDALDDGDAIHHASGGTIPFGDDQHVARAEFVDGFLKLGTIAHAFAGHFLAKDHVAALGTQGRDLTI
jgi:hypothetical protein